MATALRRWEVLEQMQRTGTVGRVTNRTLLTAATSNSLDSIGELALEQ